MHLTIGASTAPDQAAVFRAMFEARKRVFIDLLGWDVPVLAGRYELDQFDDAHAEYLILSDDAGAHLGSARLLDTTRPHLLDSVFPDLCDAPLPRGPNVREITRFCLEPGLRAAERRVVRDTLVTALAEHAVRMGIRTYTGVAARNWRCQIFAFGWTCHALGAERHADPEGLGAIRIEIEPDTPDRLRRAGITAMPMRAAAPQFDAA